VKITRIESFRARTGPRGYVFVKVHTDEGLHGVGEAYSAGPDDATQAVIADFETWLVGRDPHEVERLWQLMYNWSRFPGGVVTNSAISGIEHALWDIKGKALGVPVYQLLGGACRDRIRVYEGLGGGSPGEVAERAVALVERYGYGALKMGALVRGADAMSLNEWLKHSAARVEAVRRAVGEDVNIGLDVHARVFEPIRAMQLALAVKPYNPYFIEEPLRPENVEALGALKAQFAQLGLPLATGEMLYTKYQFRELLVRGAADIIQPDICCSGGLLEQKKIAAMAESFYVVMAPHNPQGPIATAVNVHLAACTPNFLILEYTPDEGPRRDLVDEPMKLVNGHLELPTRPGLGIDLDLEGLARHPPERWHRDRPIRADGSIGYP
jgi:galactonate dehydratase